jgi:molecular chaperone GrpE
MPDQKSGANPNSGTDPDVGQETDRELAQGTVASAEQRAGSSASADAAASADDQQRCAELTAALDAARREAGDLKDQALRAQAEADNVRKRAQREMDNARKYALERFAGELLPVLDSLERAVESARAESDSGPAAAIAEGVELSLKLFLDVLVRSGIQQIDPLGEQFNPQRHEAMSMVESADAEPGSIVHVLQKGYVLSDRLLRPAMVFVARSPANDDQAQGGSA